MYLKKKKQKKKKKGKKEKLFFQQTFKAAFPKNRTSLSLSLLTSCWRRILNCALKSESTRGSISLRTRHAANRTFEMLSSKALDNKSPNSLLI